MEPPAGRENDFAEDFELEVSDLRTRRVLDTKPMGEVEAAAPTSSEEVDDDLSVTALEGDAPSTTSRTPHLLASPRTRGIVVITVALLLCVTILLNLPGMRQGLGEVFSTSPTPTVTVMPGSDLVYFAGAVPWGTLTVDRKTAALPSDGAPVRLAPGRHSLVYSAAPFPTLLCTITVPEEVGHGTCPLTSNVIFDDQPSNARVINIGSSPNSLPVTAYSDLMRAVSVTLAANPIQSSVPVGDHYLNAQGSAVASVPLAASLSLQLNTDPSRSFPDGPGDPTCVSFCTELAQFDQAYWTFDAHAMGQWHFSTLDGDALPAADTLIDTTLVLQAQWLDNAWLVAPVNFINGYYGGYCNDVFFGSPGGTPPINLGGSFYQTITQAPSEFDGCAVVFSSSDDLNDFTVGLPSDAALYVYRFGVILAGNDLAHKLQPQFPRANGHERDLSLQWFNFIS